jgi:hypothetical protein
MFRLRIAREVLEIDLYEDKIILRSDLSYKIIKKIFTKETRSHLHNNDLFVLIEDLYSNVRRLIIRSLGDKKVLGEVLIRFYDKLKKLDEKDLFYTIYTDNHLILIDKKIRCYKENKIGPYDINERILRIESIDRDVIRLYPEYYLDKMCENNIFISNIYEKDLFDIDVEMFNRLSKGFYEDGLIWALIKSGAVSREVLPDYIMNGQAYYWPRGDLLRRCFVKWFMNKDSYAQHVYLELIDQLIDQLDEEGGLKIPYITAARRENIHGAPQQLYVFETLYRLHQISGSDILRRKALKALECFIKQPPKCLGFYDTGRGGVWFRWGSYHYLSKDPEGKEDLFVLNTHLMGVVGLLEGWYYDKCEWCHKYAEEGVKGLRNMINDFQREDGYLYYSLYNKERFGIYEDKLLPHTIGYHVLSSRLILRTALFTKDLFLASVGEKGCVYAEMILNEGRKDLRDELIRCLIELYRIKRDPKFINKIDEILNRHPDRPLRIFGLFLDEIYNNIIPPQIKISDDVTIVLLDARDGSAEYYVKANERSSLIISGHVLMNKIYVYPDHVEIKSLTEEYSSPKIIRENDHRFKIDFNNRFAGVINLNIDYYP